MKIKSIAIRRSLRMLVGVAAICLFAVGYGNFAVPETPVPMGDGKKGDRSHLAQRLKAPDEKSAPFRMVVQDGHSGLITSIAFSPDGKLIASGSWDRTVKLWSLDGRLLRTFKGHKRFVYSVAFGPGGKLIASGSWDRTVKLWTLDGKLLRTFKGHSREINSIAFSPDGNLLASGSGDKTVKLWSLGGRLLRTFKGHNKIVRSVAFSPDGRFLASGSDDKTIRQWSLDGKLLRTYKGHSDRVDSVAFSPDGRFLASGSKDKTIRLWSLDGKLLRIFKGHEAFVKSIAFSPDGKLIASGSWDYTVKLWSLDGRLLRTFKGHSRNVSDVAFSPDGKFIVSGSWSKTVKLWSLDGRLLRTFKGHKSFVYSLAFSPNGKFIALGSRDKTVKLWSLNGKLLRTFKGHSREIKSIAFGPDGKFIASGSNDKTIRLWSLDGKLLRTFKGHSGWVSSIAFSPNGKFIASGSFDTTVRLWSSDGRHLRTFGGNKFGAFSLAFSPNGKLLASGSYGNVKLWSLDGRLLRTFKGHKGAIWSVAFSPDGKLLASGSQDKTVRLWSLDGRLLRTFKGHSGWVFSIAFSPDGKFVASGSSDDTIRLWNLDSRLLRTFKGHSDWVLSVAYSPDGNSIISGSRDGTVKLWNVETGYHATLLSAGDEWVMYTPDGLFDSSRNGGRLVAMVRGLTPFGIDQFALRNNRPDLILERLGVGSAELIGHYRAQYERRLRRAGFSEAQLKGDLHVPEARITGARRDGKFIEIAFSLKDDKYNLKRYNIYVNDVPLFGAYGREITGKAFSGRERVELTGGANKIEVTAINAAGAEAFRAITSVAYEKKTKGDLYYLAFGVSRYKDGTLNLNYADKDARDLAGVFSSMKGRFANVHVKTYLNEQVTVESIKGAKSFIKNAKVDDTFVLFIAGHGVHDTDQEGTYYFLPHGAEIRDLKGTAANFDLIEGLLQGIAPRNKLFLMDTCESGEVEDRVQNQLFAFADSRGIRARTTRGIKVSLRKKQPKRRKSRSYLYAKNRFIYNDLLRRSGAIVFSASKGGEFSYESTDIENGFFTEEIIIALTSKKADRNEDGLVSTDELRAYVAKAVSVKTAGNQHPTVDRDNIFQRFGFPIPRAVSERKRREAEARRQAAIRRDRPIRPERDPVTGMEFVKVPGGSFEMGCHANAGHCNRAEKPVRTVSLDGFWMGKHEVTQGQRKRIMGSIPPYAKKGDNYPVEMVSWFEVQKFIEKLNARSSAKFRLPSEAQWEYACRSGGKLVTYGTRSGRLDPGSAKYDSGPGPAAVGTYPPNALGLHDMTGNVGEWVQDKFTKYDKVGTENPIYEGFGRYRVNRGGGWYDIPDLSRCSVRFTVLPTRRGGPVGFRLVRIQ